MESLQIKRTDFLKEIASKKSCLLFSRFGDIDFLQAIENADEKLDSTNVEYVNSMFFSWREVESISNTKIVFNSCGEKSSLLLDGDGEYKFYKVTGNYEIDYLVIIQECSGIKSTIIYGIEKA